jgi:hypothetical protein
MPLCLLLCRGVAALLLAGLSPPLRLQGRAAADEQGSEQQGRRQISRQHRPEQQSPEAQACVAARSRLRCNTGVGSTAGQQAQTHSTSNLQQQFT